jgi:hypothetical protein
MEDEGTHEGGDTPTADEGAMLLGDTNNASRHLAGQRAGPEAAWEADQPSQHGDHGVHPWTCCCGLESYLRLGEKRP